MTPTQHSCKLILPGSVLVACDTVYTFGTTSGFRSTLGAPLAVPENIRKRLPVQGWKSHSAHIFFDFPPFSHEDSHLWGTGPRLRASSAARSPPNGTSQMAVRSLRGCSCLGGSHAPFNVDIHIYIYNIIQDSTTQHKTLHCDTLHCIPLHHIT